LTLLLLFGGEASAVLPPVVGGIRPKVIVKKHDGSATYFTYDSFAPPGSGPRVIEVECEDRELEAAPFKIRIEDSGNQLDPNIGNGNKVIIQIGDTQATLQNFVAGFVRYVEIERPDTGVKEVVLNGLTNPVRAEERIVNMIRIADRLPNGIDPDTGDNTMKASEVFKDCFEDTDCYPIGGPLLPFTTSGVNDISEKLASIKEPLVPMKQVLDHVANATGTIYAIDGGDVVKLHYPALVHSGITIRDTDEPGIISPEATTGFFVGPWKFTKSIRKQDGFSNRLYGRGGNKFLLDMDKFTDSASIECHSNWRAIQFTPTAPRLNAISLVLSRTGTLTSDIQGEIRLDKSNQPTGEVIGTFEIFKDLVGTSATTINRVNISMTDKRLQVDKPHWIILKKQGDASNHFKWHHDSGTTGRNAFSSAGSSWTVQSSSYTLTHRTYWSRRILFEASSSVSIQKYGVTEDVVDAPWIQEYQDMDKLLTSILKYSSHQKVLFEPRRVYAPTTPIVAHKLIRIKDTVSGIDMDAEVKSVHYHFRADDGLASRYVEIEPIGFLP
jgi:hypothetical protein